MGGVKGDRNSGKMIREREIVAAALNARRRKVSVVG
jgi:hypothetical protein